MSSGASISALVALHGKWLMAFLRGLAGEDAEDAFQETWMRLLRLRVELREETVKAYLVKTARSVAIDRFRRRHPMTSLDVVDERGESAAEEIAEFRKFNSRLIPVRLLKSPNLQLFNLSIFLFAFSRLRFYWSAGCSPCISSMTASLSVNVMRSVRSSFWMSIR